MNQKAASVTERQITVATDINNNLNSVKDVVEGSVTVLKEVSEMVDSITEHT